MHCPYCVSHRSLAGATVLVTLCAMLAACGSSHKGTTAHKLTGKAKVGMVSPSQLGGQTDYAALQALYRRALAAGQRTVVVYGPSAGTDAPLYALFHRDFPGITVSGVPVVGPPMTAKLSAEFASGKHVADIAYTGNTDMLAYSAKGWLRPFMPRTLPSTSQLPADTLGPRDTFVGTSVAVSGTVTNTSLVPAKAVPTTWQQLLAPRWKGEIAMYDPTVVGEMADVFAHLDRVGLAQLMPGLHAQNVQISPATNLTGPLTAVAQGAKQLAIATPFAFYMGAKKAGAPVRFTLFDSDNYSVTLYMGQLRGAPDPLASELYEDWLLTPQAAGGIAREGAFSPIPGAPAPSGLPPLAQIKLFPVIPLPQVESADNGAIARAKRYWGS